MSVRLKKRNKDSSSEEEGGIKDSAGKGKNRQSS